MWVWGHSRPSELVPFESLSVVSYLPLVVTMAVALAISEIFSVKEWPDLEIWVWGRSRSLKMAPCDRPLYDFLLVRHCNYSSLLYRFKSYLTSNNIVTLKSGLEFTQGHWNWRHSKAWVQFPIRLLAYDQRRRYLVSIARYRELLVENQEIFIPHLYLMPPRMWLRTNFVKMFDARKTRMIGLPYGKKNYDNKPIS